jgi:hypothetical protein
MVKFGGATGIFTVTALDAVDTNTYVFAVAVTVLAV